MMGARIQKEFNINISISELFARQTIAELAQYISEKDKIEYTNIKPAEKREYYPVTPAQKRMFILNQIDGDKQAYNVVGAFKIISKLDRDNLYDSLNKLIKRHDILRTVFTIHEEQPVQRILDAVDFNVGYRDIERECYSKPENIEQEIKNEIRTINMPFDLESAPLLRVKLIKISPLEHVFIYCIHHIITDAVSLEILIKDITDIYSKNQLPELRLQYKDYSVWYEEILKTENKRKHEKYWLDLYKEGVPVLNLPTDYPRPSIKSYTGGSVKFRIAQEMNQSLNKLAAKTGASLYILLLAVYNVLLSKYSEQEDIVVGSPIILRPHADLENVLGIFLNTFAMRNYPNKHKSFMEFLAEVKANSLNAYENRDFQFEELVDRLKVSRDLSRNPLFDTMFELQYTNSHTMESSELCLVPYEIEESTSKFDITLHAIEDENEMNLIFQYCTALFKKETIERMTRHFHNILIQIVKDPNTTLLELSIICDDEIDQIKTDFNKTEVAYPKNMMLYQMLEQQAESIPDNTAVIYGKNKLTYSQFNKKANQLARVLRSLGVGKDSIVAVISERTVEMLIGIMSILKAGGAYLPIDPGYPEERVKYMLEDSEIDIALTSGDTTRICETVKHVLNLEDQSLYSGDDFHLVPVNTSQDLAYVIYTSGSTGRPKGTMIEHFSVINRLIWMQKKYPIAAEDIILQKTPYTFDVSVWELFWWSFNGASVCLLEQGGEKDPKAIVKAIYENNITTIHFVPSMLNVFLEYVDQHGLQEKLVSLKRIFCSGEALMPHQVQLFNRLLYKINGTRLINLYGPTEATVDVTYYDCPTDQKISNVPIGKPIDNISIYILSKDQKIQPVGIPGELCIAGDGVVRGYLKRPELQKEKFIDNPYKHGERMYRTGDLARWLSDGNIEYLGRIDDQLKIRGFRIETGEIESCLISHEAVKQAVVIDRIDKQGNKFLCAYIVPKSIINLSNLREHLIKQLPDYMIPAHFVEIPEIPVTSNGKVDKIKLRAIELQDAKSVDYEEPRNKTEEIFVKVWQDVLGNKNIGINDDFFKLGGDSIKAIQTIMRLKNYEMKLEMKDIFKHPVIKELVMYVKFESTEINQETVEGEIRPTAIQNWLFDQAAKGLHHYNQSVMLYSSIGFKADEVAKVFNNILAHHDSLRIVYKNGKLYNKGIQGELYKLHVMDLRNEANYSEIIKKDANRLQGKIDIENGPLVHLGLYKTADGDHLLIVIHHLVVDGVSWRILLEDIAEGYSQLAKGEEIKLQKKTHSFKIWSDRIQEYANSQELLNETAYWKALKQFEATQLSIENINQNQSLPAAVKTKKLQFSKEFTKWLLKEANIPYNTEISHLLLTALGLALSTHTEMENILVNVEGHGREELFDDIDITRTVGWFTSLYPVALMMGQKNDLSLQIRIVKEYLRKIPQKGIGYGILRYITSKSNEVAADLEVNPEICFNYLGQVSRETEASTLKFSNISKGASINPEIGCIHPLEISALVSEDELDISFTYNENFVNGKSIENIMNHYRKSLVDIVEHCLERNFIQFTPSDFEGSELSNEELEIIVSATSGTGELQYIYDLSPMQEGMLFHSLKDKKSSEYFEQISYSVSGNIDLNIFKESFDKLVQRYEVLRTNFLYEGLKKPRQVVLKKTAQEEVYYEDITRLEANEKNLYIENYEIQSRNKGFDLLKGILMRVAVIKTDSEMYQIIWDFHHIIMDGWCIAIVCRDFFMIYQALLQKTQLSIKDAYPYREYIKWLLKQDKSKAMTFWNNQLFGYEPQELLPRVNKLETDFILHTEFEFDVNEEITDKLSSLAVKNHVTISTLIQAIWGILLQKYSNSQDIVFGLVVSGRASDITEIEDAVGLFINTIPFRCKCDRESTFVSLIKEAQDTALLAEKYEYCSLAEIQAGLGFNRSLFDNILVFENYPVEKYLSGMNETFNIGFEIDNVHSFEQTNYDFNVVVAAGKKLNIKFRYNSSIYRNDFVQSISRHIGVIAEAVTENPHIRIEDISILTEEEIKEQIYNYNHTDIEFPEEKTVYRLFKEQAERTPDNVALEYKCSTVTYKELLEKAEQLAKVLKKKGIKNNSIVGILADRSPNMVIGIMAVISAGGAYLPIDPDYPLSRIEYILEDSGLKLVLTQSKYLSLLGGSCEVIDLEDESLYKVADSETIDSINTSNDAAYIIYTSGSTGKPKGTVICHRGLTNYICWANKVYVRGEKTSFPLYSSLSFDLTVTSIFTPLISGNRIVIYGGENKELLIKDILEENKVDIIKLTPTHLRLIQEIVNGEANIKKLIVGGEDLKVELAREIRNLFGGEVEIYNEYGPTEATVGCMIHLYNEAEDIMESVPIGKPADNTQIYILDRNCKPVAAGVIGEIYISGAGLAKGYLNNQELTEERFVQNPFKPKARMYKTGDLARMLPDGKMEFIGRADQQVKIRGHRIELGEVESVVLKSKAVKEVLVEDCPDARGDKYLVAYIVLEEGHRVQDISDYLESKLPAYMVPSKYIQLEKMPVSPNGKIDRKQLPKQEGKLETESYVPPRNSVEEKLVAIWCELLGLDRVGIHDRFFLIGGHSLTIIRLYSEIQKVFEVKININDILESDTVARQSELIKNAEKTGSRDIYPVIKPDFENIYKPFPLTEIQKAYLIGRDERFEIGGGSTHAYMEYKTDLDIKRLNKSIQRIIDRHGMLRAVIYENGTQQILQGDHKYEIIVDDISGLDSNMQQEYINKERRRMSHFVFKTDTWPLFEIKALKLCDKYNYLFISFDVLIADGYSMSIIARELGEFYKNPDLEISVPEISFRDYMNTYQNMKNSELYRIDKEYWLNQLDSFPTAPELPLKQKPSNIKNPHFRTLTKSIKKEQWSELKRIAQNKGVTPSALLLTSYAYVLAYWSNQQDMAINLTVFNRYPFHKDVNSIVGDFTSLVLVDGYLEAGVSFWENAKKLQSNLMKNLNHRHYDCVEFMREITKHRGMGTKAIMPVVFTSVLHNSDLNQNTTSYSGKEVVEELGSSEIKLSITQSSQVYIDNKAIERDGRLIATWDYVEELFNDEMISTMYNQYIGILEKLLNSDENCNISLSDKDKLFIEEYNKTETIIPLVTLHGMFKSQASRTPDNIAVILENECITYRDLDEKSNKIARYLIERNIKHGSIVGVMGHRNIHTIISILGILKAGAVYVPIDPSYPEERKMYIYKNSNCQLAVDLDIYDDYTLENYSGEQLNTSSSPDDMAYIIYTSGSTGNPKGVMITHKAAANTIIDINQKFNVSEKDKILGISSLCFDLSVYDVFGALSTGATLVLVRDQRDIGELIDSVKKYGITIWNSVPIIMDMAVQNLEVRSRLSEHDKEEKSKSSEDKYYWSPVIHWNLKNGKLYIEEHECPEIAVKVFPEFYFLTQEGICIEELFDKFSHVNGNELLEFINVLIASRVLVNSILNPQEIFSTQNRLFKNAYSEDIIYVPEESYKFKQAQLSRSYHSNQNKSVTILDSFQYPPYLEDRKTYRTFDNSREIPFNKFSYVMSILGQKIADGNIKYYYASAGGLYPIDVYVYIKEASVEKLQKGLYYYNPVHNQLEEVDSELKVTDKVYNFTNKEIFNSSAFSIYLIYNAEVNMPKYSSMGYYFACIDTGIMIGTLTQAAELAGVGLCSIGSINFDIISEHFKLNENQVLLHTVECGLKPEATEKVFDNITDNILSNETAHFELLGKNRNIQQEQKQQESKQLDGNNSFESLRFIMMSGDWIPVKLPNKLRKFCPDSKCISLGGATEAAIWSIYHQIEEIDDNWISIPYGRPLANQKIYVLNYNMDLCPVGVKGELYIGGKGVAAGYYNDKEKTQNSFIHHEKLGYIYKTGDFGILHKEGFVEFFGRKDQQIKINGYRIELGDIESQLLKHEHIREAVATVVSKDNTKKICTYIVSDKNLTKSDIVDYLRRKLPEYMLPTYVVRLDEMPLSSNGKLDRKRLPEPELELESNALYELPINGIEEKVIEIWKKLLDVKTISRNDSIFELGGDSIKAMSLVSEFYEEFVVKVSLREIFSNTTVVEMANLIFEKITQLEDLDSILNEIEREE